MHLLSITEVYPAKLKSEEKRQALTLQRVDEYNQCIHDSHVLLPDGPFSLIDMHHLTKGRLNYSCLTSEESSGVTGFAA